MIRFPCRCVIAYGIIACGVACGLVNIIGTMYMAKDIDSLYPTAAMLRPFCAVCCSLASFISTWRCTSVLAHNGSRRRRYSYVFSCFAFCVAFCLFATADSLGAYPQFRPNTESVILSTWKNDRHIEKTLLTTLAHIAIIVGIRHKKEQYNHNASVCLFVSYVQLLLLVLIPFLWTYNYYGVSDWLSLGMYLYVAILVLEMYSSASLMRTRTHSAIEICIGTHACFLSHMICLSFYPWRLTQRYDVVYILSRLLYYVSLLTECIGICMWRRPSVV